MEVPATSEFGGTNGVRFSRFTYAAPVAMNTIRTTVLMATSSVLVSADSLMPITSSAVTRSTMTAAGMLSGGMDCRIAFRLHRLHEMSLQRIDFAVELVEQILGLH